MKTTAIYHQRSGKFRIIAPIDDGGQERTITEYIGYAGRKSGRNNPQMERVSSWGPLPKGFYELLSPKHHPRLGPISIPLRPMATTKMYGRAGFYIHGDNATNDASRGCIILNRAAREAILQYGVHALEVVPD